MKNFIFLIFALMPIIGLCQTSKHTIFGIDLDSDWYTLTNQQTLAYWTQDQDKNSKFVIIDCDYIHDKIDSQFLSLGFKEMLLIFPKGYKGDLNRLSPDTFLARITYSDINDFLNKSNNNINNILNILIYKYGKPELNMINEGYVIYKWKDVYFQIVLTSRKDDLTSTLVYSKN